MLNITHNYQIGHDTFIHSFSPTQDFGVAFEDDMETGYFYAINKSEQPEVLDGLHIYDVADIMEKTLPTELQIGWSADGWKAFLIINKHYHAIFDFSRRGGYCRNGFPESLGEWTLVADRQLTEEVIATLQEPDQK
jgi:hypothetical protein